MPRYGRLRVLVTGGAGFLGSHLCARLLREHGLRIKIARIFNMNGPNMHPADGRAVSTFIVQALRGEPLTIFGDGGQTRSLCYIDDMVDGLVRLMETPDEVTRPINLGNPHEIAIADIAPRILALMGSTPELRFLPLPEDDPRQRQPDIGLAQRVLGWGPATPLDLGLVETIERLRAVMQA